MSIRDDIATAASTVTGVNVKPTYRQSLKPLDGFVKWAGRQQGDDLLGYVDTWQVWLCLSQDTTAAEEWIEAYLGDLIAAIAAEVIVTSATPAELLLGTNAVNGLIIEGSAASQ